MDGPSSTPTPILSWLVLVATIITIAVNAFAAAGYINGVTPDAVSARYPTVITPAGYAFSIWSLIYAGMIAFSIYQLSPSRLVRFSDVRAPYVVSCVLNSAWIFAWHHDLPGVCLLLIAGLAALLFWICLKLRDTDSFLGAVVSKGPFGLYFGWVTCAALVNLFVFLGSRGLTADNRLLGVFAIIAATASAVMVRWKLTNYFYPLAVAWATAAIAVKQSGNTPIVLAAAFGTVTALVTAGSVVVNLKDSTSEQR